MKYVVLAMGLFFSSWGITQEITAYAICDLDTVLMGNALEVRFIIENNNSVTFEGPDLSPFQILSGPNQSSSFSMINGKVSQSLTISFVLSTTATGVFEIDQASFKGEGDDYVTNPITIVVLENPDGIQQQPEWSDKPMPVIPQAKNPKKKRKIYKM